MSYDSLLGFAPCEGSAIEDLPWKDGFELCLVRFCVVGFCAVATSRLELLKADIRFKICGISGLQHKIR